METRSTEYPEAEVQHDEYPQVELRGEEYPQTEVTEVQDVTHLEIELQDEQHTEVEVQGEERPSPAINTVTPRTNSLMMLIVGLLAGALLGYMGRPLISSQPRTSAPATPEGVAGPSASVTTEKAGNPSTGNAASQTLMDTMIAQTRHFKGDPHAPVTIIEFSDFQ
ncbi:MAG: hypothetical protein ACE5LU_05760 [Anaerolineae bacterium]